MEPMIKFTDVAQAHLAKMVASEKEAKGFRLSLKKTGCSGYAYVPEIIKQVPVDDLHFVTQDNLHVYVDPKCEAFLNGVIVDYVDDTNTGLKQKRLVFNNPNEKNRCGCGESFTIEQLKDV